MPAIAAKPPTAQPQRGRPRAWRGSRVLDAAFHEMGLMILGFGARGIRVIPDGEPMMNLS